MSDSHLTINCAHAPCKVIRHLRVLDRLKNDRDELPNEGVTICHLFKTREDHYEEIVKLTLFGVEGGRNNDE